MKQELTDMKRKLTQQKRCTVGAMNEAAWLRINLLRILAVLHRDGGQYTETYGLEKSCEDATLLYLPVMHANERLRHELGELRKERDGWMRDYWKIKADLDAMRKRMEQGH